MLGIAPEELEDLDFAIRNQSLLLPSPLLTKASAPNQTARVFIVTGGYIGFGFELAKVSYQQVTAIHLAGRSSVKA